MALEPVPATAPLVVVAHDDPGTADSLRHAVETAAGWRVVVADPGPAGVTAALAAGQPAVALVGCGLLADLPAGCRTPLIAIGDDDRSGDVRAALAAGARSLLAWPDGVADLPGELARVAATGHPDPTAVGLVIAARGVQGGAGTTTVAVHLAAAWASWGPAPVLLVDLAGGLAFRLDLGSAPTWSTLVPVPGPRLEGPVVPVPGPRLDGPVVPGPGALLEGPLAPAPGTLLEEEPLVPVRPVPVDDDAFAAASRAFPEVDGWHPAAAVADAVARHPVTAPPLDPDLLVDAVARPLAGLAVLPLAGLVDGIPPEPPPEPAVVQAVLEAARSTYRLVVLDLPASDSLAIQTAMSHADALVAVGRCETAGVRGLQAALDAWAAAGHDPDAAGAVVTGVRPQAPLAPREVRAALGDRLWGLIPAAAPELAAAAEDGVLLLDRHDLSAVKAMLTLANRVVPFAAVPA